MGQLEALSEMMNGDSENGASADNILALYEQESKRTLLSDDDVNQLSKYEGAPSNNASAIEASMESKSSQSVERDGRAFNEDDHNRFYNFGDNPWPQLVEELRRKIRFLERDRTELARITQVMLTMERESNAAKLDAAVATAKRESMEHLQLYKQRVNQKMKSLYSNLCLTCQRRIYAAT